MNNVPRLFDFSDIDIFIVMKILITESQLNELFSQSMVTKLIKKFQSENPNLEDRIIRHYIQRFEQLKNSPKVREKDINKYSWKDLETLIDMNQPKTIKTNIVIPDSDLIYNQNNLKIYQANSQEACVKYGNGYSFCVSARSEDNMYDSYRIDQEFTIYFVRDEDRTTEPIPDDPDNMFKDPIHLLVIMVRERNEDVRFNIIDKDEPRIRYQVTTANNDGETNFDYWEGVAKIQPKLTKLEKLFVTVKPTEKEIKLNDLKNDLTEKLRDLAGKYNKIIRFSKTVGDIQLGGIYDLTKIELIKQILQGKPTYYYQGYNKSNERNVRQIRMDKISREKWLKDLGLDPSDEDDYYSIVRMEIEPITFSNEYINYLQEVWSIYKDYLHQKNLLNIE